MIPDHNRTDKACWPGKGRSDDGKKSGIINIHMGDCKDPFKQLYDASSDGKSPREQFLPTHCNRIAWIFEDAESFGKHGYFDITARAYPYFPDEEVKPSKAVAELLKAGVSIEHITPNKRWRR